MFIDQEKKEKGFKKWGRRFLKLSFVLFALVAIFVTILANMGGTSDTLKGSVENFFSEAFGGKPANIEKLVRISFFPSVGVDLERIKIIDPKPLGSVKDTRILLMISKIKFFMDFWDVVFANPKFRTFLVEDAYLAKNVFGQKELRVERIYIDQDEKDSSAKLIANGKYGKELWSLKLDLLVHGAYGKSFFEIGERTNFEVTLSKINISGVLLKSADHYMKLESLKITDGVKFLHGDIFASLISSSTIKVKGSVSITDGLKENFNFELLFDYMNKPLKISGNLEGKEFSRNDLFGESSVESIFYEIYNFVRDEKTAENNSEKFLWVMNSSNLDVNFKINDYEATNKKKISMAGRVNLNDGNALLEDLKGVVEQKEFSIPKLMVLRDVQDNSRHPNFFMLAESTSLIPDLFFLLQEKPVDFDIFPGKSACAFANVYKNPIGDVVTKISNSKLDSPITISSQSYTFLASAFSDGEGKDCMSYFTNKTK